MAKPSVASATERMLRGEIKVLRSTVEHLKDLNEKHLQLIIRLVAEKEELFPRLLDMQEAVNKAERLEKLIVDSMRKQAAAIKLEAEKERNKKSSAAAL